jgi:hypothetical protein
MAAYTYGHSRDISNGIRNSMESNWQLNQSLTPNNPVLANSNFDIRHRIVSMVAYKKDWNEKYSTYITLVFTGQSGSPYTWGITANNKQTNSGQQVDLFYIPKSQSDIQLVDNGSVTAAQQWAALDAYINKDPYLSKHRGEYSARNEARTPWNNQLDLRLMQDIHFKHETHKRTLQITFDVVNITNLINPNWGWQYFVPNTLNSTAAIGLTPKGTVNGNQSYTFSAPTTLPYSIDKLNSRWQAQVGVRFTF